ncbi:MAG TPA: FAD-dependent oxidoreductase [Syntrophales bacterium]|nr:FAD-dependent oxidoreductase [Syntrophales bacterium]HOL60114.1 FAD-dependent oxidoreductase [Syntrophales bacterium]HPO36195.1 FAD-dependent oxidoreductase [Syntrophales bacterium]
MTGKKMNVHMLFRPVSIGGVKIKNRLVVAPMVTVFCDEKGMATDRFIAYHEAKARGGWGMIIVEDYAVDPLGRGFWTPGLWDDEQVASHARLVSAVHKAGAKIIAQIYHAGRQTTSALIGAQPVSSSPLPCPVLGELPRELSIQEIKKIVSQFGDAALRAKKAGFDGVEVHGAHGYLIAQFMSKYANKRTDEYGGSLENRLRFPLEIISDIRKKCGPDFLIDFRISGDEMVPGGRTIEETKAIAVELEKHGIDLIHISAGTYESTWAIIPPMGTKLAWIVDYAAEVKKVVEIPVMTVGRINDPWLAESILRSGKADLIAMGRASLADPELPNKFARGQCEDIRPCIGCQQGCLEVLFRNEPIRCLVNPTLGFEYRQELKKAKVRRKVTVVGGGPAGMEAARAAALAGHEVTLYERGDRLGGQFALAAVPPGKGDITPYLAWAIRQLQKLGVTVKLNTEYSAAWYKKEKPDAVIIATGASPARPPIKGIEGTNVLTAEEVLKGKALPKQKVVIAGGGIVGCETATYLASMGRQVTIVEMLPMIAADEEYTRRFMLLKMMEEKKIEIVTEAEIVEINAKGVRVKKNGSSYEITADTVVLAMGMTSNDALAKSLGKQANVKVVGDALTPRNALEAIREGFLAGASIS